MLQILQLKSYKLYILITITLGACVPTSSEVGKSKSTTHAINPIPVNVETTLYASNAVRNDEFGKSVAISGNYAVVSNNDFAHLFEHNGEEWSEVDIVDSDDIFVRSFGNSVDIYNDTIIVGAYESSFREGVAYIFKRTSNGWREEEKLTASDADSGDYFGYSVALSENYAIVGAYENDELASRAGAAYIFKRDGTSWIEVSKVTASDGEARDKFGTSVALSENYAIVGAPETEADRGTAYIFKREGDTWSEIAKLEGEDAFDNFGDSVAISDNLAMVTAPGVFPDGVTYVYELEDDVWTETDQLISDLGGINNEHMTVDFFGDYAVVGITDVFGKGSATIFERKFSGQWREVKDLSASVTRDSDSFGLSVGISEEYVIIGAFENNDMASDAGAAHIFKTRIE